MPYIPSAYELYIYHERERYGWENSEENDFPWWLILEQETIEWLFKLSRKMQLPHNNGIVSKRLLKQIEQIPTIRFLRYRDISPSLKQAITVIAQEFTSLYQDLKAREMWKKPNLLSKNGIKRWQRTAEVVSECNWKIKPDPEWREQWEKENVQPYCTRREAEAIAFAYIRKSKGIDLNEIDQDDKKHKYYYFLMAKEGVFKMKYGIWVKEKPPFHDIGIIEVDMLSLRIRELQF